MLSSFRDFVFRQKYRFDLGLQFLVFVNFALLVITAGDKLRQLFGWKTSESLLLLLPLAFIATWGFGYFLDKVVRSPQAQERQSISRSEAWNKLYRKLDRIEGKVEKIQKEKEKEKRKKFTIPFFKTK